MRTHRGVHAPPPRAATDPQAPTFGRAPAMTIEDYHAQLSQLRADTIAAQGSFTNAKDVDAAVRKLDAAAAKLEDGKHGDASQKLTDFQSLLNALADRPEAELDPAVAP